eukprot:Gb_05788 [translate_table: standard]
MGALKGVGVIIIAMFVVVCSLVVCKKLIGGDLHSICMVHSSPICQTSIVEEFYSLPAKIIEWITTCGYKHNYMSGLEQFALANNWNISTKMVSVDDFGAIGDGLTDDTQAFENAWKEACFSAPSVFLVPEGKQYLVEPINFSGPCPSPITVQVSGTIIAPEDPNVWEETNSSQWLGFHGVNDITVEGGGTIYGRGEKWWAESCKINKTNPCRSAPTALRFESSNNLMLRNLTVLNSQQIHITFRNCVGVEANLLEVKADENSPNTDGIHVSASKFVIVKNSIIGTGDDCISIVSDSFNILIQNVSCGPGHGISIGSLGKANSDAQVSNVVVDGASFHNTTNGLRIKTWQGGSGFAQDIGLRIKTWQGGSGFAQDIIFQNVVMDNVSHPIIIDQYYWQGIEKGENLGIRIYIMCPDVQTSAVKVSEVAYMNVKGTSATKEVVRFACSQSVPCNNIFLAGIDLTLTSGDTPTAFCENAMGFSIGLVTPPPCFQNYTPFEEQQIISQSVPPQQNHEL